MPIDPAWIPTGPGSQLLYQVVSNLDAIVTPLTTLAALQSALDNDRENGQLPVLSSGETNLTGPLVIDGGSGGGLYGQGRPEPIETSDANLRGSSTLVYTGTKASNEAAIVYKRTDFVFQDLAIQGKTTAQIRNSTGTNTPRGIFLSKDTDVGSGKWDMRFVRLSGFDVAIDAGDALATANCDECGYYSVFSDRNGTFFRSNNIQGLSHKFYNLRVTNTDTVFNYLAGGKMAVTDLFLGSPCTLLQLRNDNPTGFGQNGSRWVFRGVDLDSSARNSKLLDFETGIPYFAHVVYDGVHFSRNDSDVWDNYAWHIGDQMHVTIDDAHNLMGGMIKYTTTEAKSSVTINCGTSLAGQISVVEDLFDPASTGPSPMVIINNLMPNGGQTPLNFSDTL